MKKGIIMEINERFLTVLTPEGEFLRACNDNGHYQIGQEITFIPIMQKDKQKNALLTFFQGKFMLPSAAVLMLAFLFFIPFYQNNQVYAYLSIDINPSIELGVNKKYQVIQLQSYNHDGEKIIKQIQDWKREDADKVVSHIVDEIQKQGYMEEKKKMVVAAVYSDEEIKKQDSWKKEMKVIEEIIHDKKLNLTIVEGTESEREKAKKEGLTLGLYKEKKWKENRLKAERNKKRIDDHSTVEKNNKQIDDQSKSEWNKDNRSTAGWNKERVDDHSKAEKNKKQTENHSKEEKNKKSISANKEEKSKQNHIKTEKDKQKELSKTADESKVKNISPGQNNKEEKQPGTSKTPADTKQKNTVTTPVEQQTKNKQDETVQEQKVKEYSRNSDKHYENTNNDTVNNERNDNTAGTKNQNRETNSSGTNTNPSAFIDSDRKYNKDEK